MSGLEVLISLILLSYTIGFMVALAALTAIKKDGVNVSNKDILIMCLAWWVTLKYLSEE